MWKKKEAKKEEKEEDRDVSLLKEVCGDDAKLGDFLNHYLLLDPVAGISKKTLAVLIEEAEKSGDSRLAVEKAIFEAAQNPDDRERYVNILRDLASKTIRATEEQEQKAQKEQRTDRAASLRKTIENQRFMSSRAGDIIHAASKFYTEKLVELGENARREERSEARRVAEAKEWGAKQAEKDGREARKKERMGMGREDKRESEAQDKREELAAEARKQAGIEQREEAEREEQRIGAEEEAARQTRREERGAK